jgi:two-component system, cell cycle response regulator
MRYKLLTVDDSKTVRIIVKKAFKNYDCEILEAANGVEGLAVAAKETPSLILLDITMPVMDGVEMLTKLKSDPELKNIPVIMLTAEGGRDNVLKIAKIGVRDYVVKPFKEDILIQKVGRIIDLKPISDSPTKAKSIFDEANILVVEDKPAILRQIQTGLAHTPWLVKGVTTTGEAIDFSGQKPVDLVIISLSLPEQAAFTLFRVLRSNLKTKYTPIFGLVVKTDTAMQNRGQQMGFSALVTKPLDMSELESKIARAMNLDTSERYFSSTENTLVMKLPAACTSHVINEASTHLKGKVADAIDAGINQMIFDLHEVTRLDMPSIKLLISAMQACREVALHYAIVGSETLAAECQGYEDTHGWQFHPDVATAEASFNESSAELAEASPR